MSVHNGSHTGEHTQRCSQTWVKGTLFRDSCLESQNRGWPHRCWDEWFVRNTKKKASAKKLFQSVRSPLGWETAGSAEHRASVYGGFPAIASLTAGELQTFICSLLSLNNGEQFQEKAAREEVVTTSPLVSVFTTLMLIWAQILCVHSKHRKTFETQVQTVYQSCDTKLLLYRSEILLKPAST